MSASRWLRMLIWPIGLVTALVGGLWLFQRRLIYLPSGQVPAIERVAPGWSDVELSTTDGLALRAWWHPPGPEAPVVILFPGNAGNRADRTGFGRLLAARGYGVLLVDYRGYGGNPGTPSESGLAADAGAARAFVAETAPGHRVVYFGESLGAAVAVGLAAADPPDALVLRSPFTSLADAAATHYPYLPVRLLLKDEYPSAERMPSITAPVLVIAGSADSIVPAEQSRRIYELAAGPKELLVIEGADHNDAELSIGTMLVETTVRFIAEATGP